eukprot:358486-Chlamydomonas_euryale.AAC.25
MQDAAEDFRADPDLYEACKVRWNEEGSRGVSWRGAGWSRERYRRGRGETAATWLVGLAAWRGMEQGTFQAWQGRDSSHVARLEAWLRGRDGCGIARDQGSEGGTGAASLVTKALREGRVRHRS